MRGNLREKMEKVEGDERPSEKKRECERKQKKQSGREQETEKERAHTK